MLFPFFFRFPLINSMCSFPSYYLCEVLKLSEAYNIMLYYIFNTMLLTLLVFHLYWWILICSMITRQLKNRGKVGEDIRSGKRLNCHFEFSTSTLCCWICADIHLLAFSCLFPTPKTNWEWRWVMKVPFHANMFSCRS